MSDESEFDLACRLGDAARRAYLLNGPNSWVTIGHAIIQELRNSPQEEPAVVEAPPIGSWWTHKNGSRYQVKAIANTASTNDKYPVTVVYQGAYGHWWTRPLSEWYDSMTPLPLGA